MIAIRHDGLSQKKINTVIRQVSKRFDSQNRRFKTTCTDELTATEWRLRNDRVYQTKDSPDGYLYRCLVNTAKKFYKELAIQWKHEKPIETCETNALNCPLHCADLELDFREFIQRLDPSQLRVMPVLTGTISAKELSYELGISDKAIYKRCDRLANDARVFFREYRYDSH